MNIHKDEVEALAVRNTYGFLSVFCENKWTAIRNREREGKVGDGSDELQDAEQQQSAQRRHIYGLTLRTHSWR